MRGAVAPAAVGVDMGCGMAAVATSLTAARLPDDLEELRLAIEATVPVGRAQHRVPVWQDSVLHASRTRALLDRFFELDTGAQHFAGRVNLQLGTLGGGNHFIELCLDTNARVWLMLHSGSRFIGAALPERHMQAMSRSQARRAFTRRDLIRQTAGVECRKDSGVIDEAPKAYKDIHRVMEQQQDLVEIVAELKQVLCVKG